MKVGRAALDEDAIRMLEELNPGIEFDWTRILKVDAPAQEMRPPAPPRRPGGPPRQPGSRRERDRRPESGFVEIETSGPDSAAERAEPVAEPVASAAVPEPEEYRGADESLADGLDRAELDPIVDRPAGDREHAAIEDAGLELARALDEPASLLPSAAQARLGTEGIVRLRGRYAEVLARIDERIGDAARRDELKAQAERLNPDAWVTDPEVQAGLEQYETVFDSLRAVVGRRRRRRRRRGGRQQPGSPETSSHAGDAGAAGDNEDEEDL